RPTRNRMLRATITPDQRSKLPRSGSSQGAAREGVKETPEGTDVVDIIDDRDVLVRRVICRSRIPRAEPRDGDPERVADLSHRPRACEQRVPDRFGAVSAAARVEIGRASCRDTAWNW